MGEENKGVKEGIEEEIEETEEIDENNPDSLDFELDELTFSTAEYLDGGDEKVLKKGEEIEEDPEKVKVKVEGEGADEEVIDPLLKDGASSEEAPDEDPEIDLISEIERLNAIINQGVPEDEGGETSDETALIDAEGGNEEVGEDFVGELDMDDVSADPKVFSKVLANFGRQIQEETVKSVMTTIPKLISNQVQQHLYMTSMRDKFYVDNPDLSHVKNVVASCASEIVKEHSDWKMDQIYTEAAIRSRKVLGINAPSKERKIETPADAAFTSPSGGGTRQKVNKERTFQDELDEL